MKILLLLLLLPCLAPAQTAEDGRQLVALKINADPDQTDGTGKFYLMANKPLCVKLKPNQTFLLQSIWHNEGDSIVSIGAGTGNEINDSIVELRATLYPGKKIQKGDIALFLVPLAKPATDTLFFKMARLAINFKTIDDSDFYERNKMLQSPSSYSTNALLQVMAADIRRTGDAMAQLQNSQDQKIKSGIYKDQMLFAMMQKTTPDDVLKFIFYVYAKPDKYKAHDWKVCETFATWVINGAPLIYVSKII